MNKRVLIAMLALCGVGMTATALASGGKPTMGVAEFKNETQASWWRTGVGSDLAGMLSNELGATNNFTMVERAKLDVVLQEQNLSAAGRVSKSTAVQMGKVTGAQYLVMGTVTAYEENASNTGGGIAFKGIALGGKKSEAYVAVDVRVVDTTTGEIPFTRTIEGRSSSSGIAVGVYKDGFGGSFAKQEKTPAGKAVRAALIEVSSYLDCYMVKKDGCMAEFDAKEQKRRASNQKALKLD